MFSSRSNLAQADPELWAAIQQENQRQEDHIELIASENYASPAVLEAQGSQLTNKYAGHQQPLQIGPVEQRARR